MPGTDTAASGAAAAALSASRSRSRKVGLRSAKASAFHGGVRGRPRKLSRRPAGVDQRVVRARARGGTGPDRPGAAARAGCSTAGRTRGTRGSSAAGCRRPSSRSSRRPGRRAAARARSRVTRTPRSASPVAAASPAIAAADHHHVRPAGPAARRRVARRGRDAGQPGGRARAGRRSRAARRTGRLRQEGVHDTALPAGDGLAVHAGEPGVAQSPPEPRRPVESGDAAPQVAVERGVAGEQPARRG